MASRASHVAVIGPLSRARPEGKQKRFKRRPKRTTRSAAFTQPGGSEITFGKPLVEDPIKMALQALQNTRTVSVLETKDGSTRSIKHDATVLKVMRAFFPSGKEYNFRLAATVVPYSSDGSGNFLATSSFSPAVATFTEWSGIAALFDEVVLRRARVTIVGGASGNKDVGMAIGYNPNNISALPANTSSVIDLAEGFLVNSYTTAPRLAVVNVVIPRGRAWAETTVPAVASPPAGCVGTVDFANAGASGTVSVVYFYALCEIMVTLRNRI